MKKRLLSVVLTLLLVFPFVTAHAATQNVNIIINGKAVIFSEDSGQPYVDQNSRTMVPLRATMEAVGAAVGYDKNTQTAIVIMEHDRIEVPIGTDYLYNNNEKIQNDTTSVVTSGRTYLPIRAVLESAGYTVEWDKKSNSVIAYNFTFDESTFVPYSTSSIETLAKAVLAGNVVYVNGEYYATPEYVKMLTNTQIQYLGDDLNTAIYPQDSRFDFADWDGSLPATEDTSDIDGVS